MTLVLAGAGRSSNGAAGQSEVWQYEMLLQSPHLQSRDQILRQRLFERHVGARPHIIDTIGIAARPQFIEVFLHDTKISRANQVWPGLDLFGYFQSIELYIACEREVDFVWMHYVKERDVVPLKAQVLDSLQEHLHIGEYVRDDED